MSLSREELLLLFLSVPGGRYPTDQIRIMKGLFLLSQEGPANVRGAYDFKPYDYGPFDTQVYRDLDLLESRGLIAVEALPGISQRVYRLTPRGQELAARAHASTDSSTAEAVAATKRHVTALGFVDLLRDVYCRYPKFAAKSVARV